MGDAVRFAIVANPLYGVQLFVGYVAVLWVEHLECQIFLVEKCAGAVELVPRESPQKSLHFVNRGGGRLLVNIQALGGFGVKVFKQFAAGRFAYFRLSRWRTFPE